MPIQEGNIQFLESQVLDDVPEGGGAATGRVVEDGKINNVYPDISDLDRAYGRLRLRKLFLGVRSLDTDLYGGAKLAVTGLPSDPSLGYTLFTTDDQFDARTDAANAVEAYLYKGPKWSGELYDDHIEGMRAIRVFQRVGTTLPAVGKTLALVYAEGQAAEREQYVRITKVESAVQTFEDDKGEYQRLIVTLYLSDALRADYAGHTPSRVDNYTYTARTKVRDTTVADATRYYSTQRLAESASIGDLKVRAESIFTALVPSAQTETPLVNQSMSGVATARIAAGGGLTVEIAQTAHTRASAVTAETRRLNWIEQLWPRPAPGSVSVAFMSQGNWYELTDDGAGTIAGSDATLGAGTVDYVTGDTLVTLGALPDAGSQILWTWASPVHYEQALTDLDPRGVRLPFTLPQTPYVAGSLSVAFQRGGAAVTATADNAGVISGSGVSGSLDRYTGAGELWFSVLPDRSTAVTFTWTYSEPNDPEAPTERRITTTIGAGYVVDFGGPVPVGAVSIIATYAPRNGYPVALTIRDDGNGALVVAPGQTMPGEPAQEVGGSTVGSIDYAIGLAVLGTPLTANIRVFEPAETGDGSHFSGGAWVVQAEPILPGIGGTAYGVVALSGAATGTAATPLDIDLSTDGVALDLTATSTDATVPGSLRFVLGGKTYEDRSGTLYTDIDPQTGAGLAAGSFDHETGVATLTYWTNGASAIPTVQSQLVRFGQWTGVDACFRTALSPIKPQALSLRVTTADGVELTASADADGNLVGDHVEGTINYEFGTASLRFGADNAGTWEPRTVDPSTLRYNAVAYSYLPLDADILGIDPVRLPSDGRVPVFRDGDIVYVMHTAQAAPATITDGGTLSAGRTRLAWVRVIDADGKTLAGDLYTLDRTSGIVTVPDVTGLAQPLTLRHTVADLRMVTDTQISGWLALSRALTHDYPAGESLVASCLLFGDRRARVSSVWDQASWDGVWRDQISGSAATATLNTIDYPITVTNEGCDTDRWVFRCTNASTNAWELISEKRGLVWSGVYAPYTSGVPVDVAPINPRTRTPLEDGVTYVGGVPYLTIPQRANGGGWSTGNCVFILTIGAIADFWIANSIQQSDEPADPAAPDGVEIYALGNVDRP